MPVSRRPNFKNASGFRQVLGIYDPVERGKSVGNFVRAIEDKRRSIIYFDSTGNRMIRRGGTWAWRNNNPGNIIKGPKARKLGSIGTGGGFAVFPSLQSGREALRAVLITSYPNTTLFRLVEHYAPKKENDVENYRRLLRKFTGLSLQRKISTLNTDELERLMDGIKNIEGFRGGEEEILGPAKKIIDVKRNKKQQITGYIVEGMGGLSPVETVKGIISGEIDGVVADRGGRTYVRTRPDPLLENNLETKGK